MNIDPKLIEHLPDPDLILRIAKKLRDATMTGVPMQRQLNYSHELMEKLYATAHVAYEKERVKEALEIFENLFYLNPLDYKVCLAAGASAQRLTDWYRAILYYGYAMEADPENPEPPYFAAECCVQIGKDAVAQKLYGKASEKCGNKHEYQELKARASGLRDGLKKRLQEGKAPLCVEAQSAPTA